MIGPIINAATAAGTPLAQTNSAETERAGEAVGAQRRRVYHERKAESAAGVGEPDGEDHETAQRDGDGRRPWEDQPEFEKNRGKTATRQSKDPSRQSGNFLDLTG